jgi:hypothetical protein
MRSVVGACFGGIAVELVAVAGTTAVSRIATVVSGRGHWGRVAGTAVVAAFVVEVVTVGCLRTPACSLVVAIATITACATITAVITISGLIRMSSNH